MRCGEVQNGLFGSLCACFLFLLASWVGSQQGEMLGKPQSSLEQYINLSTKSPTRAGREVLNGQILYIWKGNENKCPLEMALDFPPALGTVILGPSEPSETRGEWSLYKPWAVRPREHRLSFLVCFDSVCLAIKRIDALCCWPPSWDCYEACSSTSMKVLLGSRMVNGFKDSLWYQRDLFLNLTNQLCDFGQIT